jgi:hypothetical protein
MNNQNQRQRQNRRPNRNRRRRGTANRRQRNNGQQLFGHGDQVKIPNYLHPNAPTPMTQTVKMSFIEPTLVLNSAVSPYVIREWRINDIFDPDPLIGGGTVAGYTHYTTAYNRFRVFKHMCQFTICGNEPAVPVTFGLIYRDARPSTIITSYAQALNALEVGPSSGISLVGQTTGSSVHRSRMFKIHPGAIMGDPEEYMSDINWAGSTGFSPPQTVWVAIIAVSISPLNPLTNGIILTMNQWFTVKWSSSQKTLELEKSHDVTMPCRYCFNVHNMSRSKMQACACECHEVGDSC